MVEQSWGGSTFQVPRGFLEKEVNRTARSKAGNWGAQTGVPGQWERQVVRAGPTQRQAPCQPYFI